MLFSHKLNSYLAISIIAALLLYTASSFAQESGASTEAEELEDFIEDSMEEIDFYSLEELLDVEIEVASLFAENELVVGSMVSSISSDQWNKHAGGFSFNRYRK